MKRRIVFAFLTLLVGFSVSAHEPGVLNPTQKAWLERAELHHKAGWI